MNFSFDVLTDIDVIEIHLLDTDKFIDLPIPKFWDWVVKNELNHYCLDFHDPSKADGQLIKNQSKTNGFFIIWGSKQLLNSRLSISKAFWN